MGLPGPRLGVRNTPILIPLSGVMKMPGRRRGRGYSRTADQVPYKPQPGVN